MTLRDQMIAGAQRAVQLRMLSDMHLGPGGHAVIAINLDAIVRAAVDGSRPAIAGHMRSKLSEGLRLLVDDACDAYIVAATGGDEPLLHERLTTASQTLVSWALSEIEEI